MDHDNSENGDHRDHRGGGVGNRGERGGDLLTRDLLTVEQAAAYLHLSASSIRSYIRQGTLQAFRVAGKRKVLIARAALLALLEPTHTGTHTEAYTEARAETP